MRAGSTHRPTTRPPHANKKDQHSAEPCQRGTQKSPHAFPFFFYSAQPPRHTVGMDSVTEQSGSLEESTCTAFCRVVIRSQEPPMMWVLAGPQRQESSQSGVAPGWNNRVSILYLFLPPVLRQLNSQIQQWLHARCMTAGGSACCCPWSTHDQILSLQPALSSFSSLPSPCSLSLSSYRLDALTVSVLFLRPRLGSTPFIPSPLPAALFSLTHSFLYNLAALPLSPNLHPLNPPQ